jgi:hypothetical protein
MSGWVSGDSDAKAAAVYVEAIDFQKLYRDEKRKARLKMKAQRQQEQEKTAIDTSTTDKTTADDGNTIRSVEQQRGQQQLAALSPSSPLWCYPELRPLSRTDMDCVSVRDPATIYYRQIFLLENRNYQAPAGMNSLEQQGCTNNSSGDYSTTTANNGINTSYHDALWNWLLQLPENTNNCSDNDEAHAVGKWTTLPHAKRRVALFLATTTHDDAAVQGAGSTTPTTTMSHCSPFPAPLQPLIDAVTPLFINRSSSIKSNGGSGMQNYGIPNHILINDYGTTAVPGILPHTDGPAYEPCTVTVSLGPGNVLLNFASSCSLDGVSHASATRREVLLHGGGSIVLFEGEAYSTYKHSIAYLDSHHGNSNNSIHNEEDNGGGYWRYNNCNNNVEYSSDMCCNAAPGTAVQRDRRISITIRHKKVL